MKAPNLITSLVLLAGTLLLSSSAVVQACPTCRLSRGSDVTLMNGAIVIPGSVGDNPNHWGVSYAENPPLPVPTASSVDSPMAWVANSLAPVESKGTEFSSPALIDTALGAITVNKSPSLDASAPEGFGTDAAISVVPEPAALVLLSLGLFAGLKCRRR